jgi:hypothetical protein
MVGRKVGLADHVKAVVSAWRISRAVDVELLRPRSLPLRGFKMAARAGIEPATK